RPPCFLRRQLARLHARDPAVLDYRAGGGCGGGHCCGPGHRSAAGADQRFAGRAVEPGRLSAAGGGSRPGANGRGKARLSAQETSMRLTDDEQAMLDGRDGPAAQRAMDLLLRYGNALGAERLVETNNVTGTVTATTPFMRDFGLEKGGMDAIFSEFSLDSDVVVPIPKVKTYASHLQLGFDPEQPERMGLTE